VRYDLDLFHRWRKIAVTDISQIKLGDKLWCNNGDSFTVMGFIEEADFNERVGLIDPIATGVVAVSTECRFHPLAVYNVGGSFTPWLLFRDEATCRACAITLQVTIDR
jgi:hypothetical protein